MWNVLRESEIEIPFISGTYKIDVLHGAKPVLGSPFFCQAFDAAKMKLQELGPMTISVHDHIAFKRE